MKSKGCGKSSKNVPLSQALVTDAAPRAFAASSSLLTRGIPDRTLSPMGLRIGIAALVAALALALSAPGAGAGVRPLGAGNGVPASGQAGGSETPAGLAAAMVEELGRIAPGLVTPLFPDASAAPPPVCSGDSETRTFALLIGADDAGAPFGRLAGALNDMDLMAAALTARGIAAFDIITLAGSGAVRGTLAQAFQHLLDTVDCGDRVLIHFSGHAARPRDLIDALVPKAIRERFSNVAIDQIWATDYTYDANIAALRWADRSELFLVLNGETAPDGASRKNVVSIDDISEFVTRARNRMVDVVVFLDTSYAAAADLSGRQYRVGDNTLWTNGGETGDGRSWDEIFSPRSRLYPARGGFAAFYSSASDSHSIELFFETPDGDRRSYGVFTFRLATAIQNRDSVTVRTLADAVRPTEADAQAGSGHSQQLLAAAERQRLRVEASDAEMVLFTDVSLPRPEVDPITITRPTPKRGGLVAEKPEVEIEGVVNWSTPARAVVIAGQTAFLDAAGRFKGKAMLQTGLNQISVVALTADGRAHQHLLELQFEGDRKALEGEGARYALIIANQNYRPETGYSSLKTPFADADAVAAILAKRYGYRTALPLQGGSELSLMLRDASSGEIQNALFELSRVAGEKDQVLVYYAGHGIYEELTSTAYWVTSDSRAGQPFTYLDGDDLDKAIRRIQARSVIVISDSCFSGALLRGGAEEAEQIAREERTRALLRLAQKRSRILISSGSNEPVEDTGGQGHSVFARALLTGLETMEEDAFSARELFDEMILPKVLGRSEQEPQYRPIERSGHEGGDVVFVRTPG